MNQPSFRTDIVSIGCLSLALMTVPILNAEPRCPGNVAGVTPRFIQHALIVIPVWINQSGPYDFMLDTGSQVTAVDPSLAMELNLKPRGTVGVFTVAGFTSASITILDSLEASSYALEKPLAVIEDLQSIQAADPHIRGILGENFLSHFDLLIDYAHKRICLDQTKTLHERVHGEHVPLVVPNLPESESRFGERLVVAVHLSGAGTRPILLQLDSGSDGALLHSNTQVRELKSILRLATRRGSNASNAQRAFSDLPPQDLHIGSLTLGRIAFTTQVTPAKDVPSRDEDGVLPTLLFQRVFISGSEHYVVLDSW